MPSQWRSHLLLLLLFLLAFAFLSDHPANSQPLSTRGRWIVDAASRRRVKLHCVNWAAHMPAVLAEGLDKQPLSSITMRAASLGFNCVRLTWATQLFTNMRYQNMTSAESLLSLGLTEAAQGVARNNPELVGITVRAAYDKVVQAIGDAGMMVVLDNHVSKPQWCCRGDDGNGFFGDLYFDPDEWIRGLDIVAKRFRRYPQVVGMSMRNELRGPRQSKQAWYANIARGASSIHEANPDVLIIVSGLHFDTDLSFLRSQPLNETYDDKLVFEAHWYSFSQRHDWASKNPNYVCSKTTKWFNDLAAFLIEGENGDAATPLFVSEFGGDQRGWSRADNRYLSCFLAFAAAKDLDSALWTLQGSYYLRNGVAGFEEPYGVLDSSWVQPQNPKFHQRFELIQEILQDPDSSAATYHIIYHPYSGQCVYADQDDNILLSDCSKRSKWIYGGNGTVIRSAGTERCLRVAGEGLQVLISRECGGDGRSVWGTAFGAKHQMLAEDEQGTQVCLDGNSTNSVVITRECICLHNASCSENPETQWFEFVPSNLI